MFPINFNIMLYLSCFYSFGLVEAAVVLQRPPFLWIHSFSSCWIFWSLTPSDDYFLLHRQLYRQGCLKRLEYMWPQVTPNSSLPPEDSPTLLSDKHNILSVATSLLCPLFILFPLFSRKNFLFRIHMLQTLASILTPKEPKPTHYHCHPSLILARMFHSSYANAKKRMETLGWATSDVWKQLLASLCFKQYVPNCTCSLNFWLLFCFSWLESSVLEYLSQTFIYFVELL